MNKFYITTAIPYVNAKPHIGFASELIQTDTIARYHRVLGENTYLLTGSDDNALKNVQAAEKEGIPVEQFVNDNAVFFKELAERLNISVDVFQQGSDKKVHFPASQKLWQLCDAAGDIYKKTYKGLYCVGCETFYTLEELNEDGECFEHPGRKLEEVEEENYFFKLSKYQEQIIQLLESNALEIVPAARRNEMLSFLKNPLQDISISRSNERAKNWGVPVPGDETQRMYVWFDALNIYQSGVGFNSDEEKYQKWWPADVHVIGKGIIRFHAIYWPAFLVSAGLPLPKKLFVHEYFTVDGQKMSKTLGNVLDPMPLIEQYGPDPIRYYCLAKTSPFSDGDFSVDKLNEVYTADLANGLGNLVSRVAKLSEKNNLTAPSVDQKFLPEIEQTFQTFKFNEGLQYLWTLVAEADKKVSDEKPWELEGDTAKEILLDLITRIQVIAYNLQPFLPTTAEKILQRFSGQIQSGDPLFPRI